MAIQGKDEIQIIKTKLCHPNDFSYRLPDSWWPDFGPTPSADASGNTGICHDIYGTDGLSFSPGVKVSSFLDFFLQYSLFCSGR